MPVGQRGLEERTLGSECRKTGLMVASGLGAAEDFFWGLKVSRTLSYGPGHLGMLHSVVQDGHCSVPGAVILTVKLKFSREASFHIGYSVWDN